jgi:hypothetical protein
MDISVLLEPLPDRRFRASTGAPWQVECSADTPDEAVEGLRRQIAAHLQAGAKILSISVDQDAHPFARYVGDLRDDPMLADFQAAIQEYRRARDPEDYE